MQQIAKSPRNRSTLSSFATGAIFAVAGVILQSASASAISLSVERACMGDYFAYCSQHSVGSQSLRRCMSDAGPRLSNRCVKALIAAGEVSKEEVARRAASR
ncbi:MAG: hypothetical protein KDJ47_11555 [Hyphomicrobiaceae bacterium]|nr:hypothetical protein [Hyphomicrobiaceae bacterium]